MSLSPSELLSILEHLLNQPAENEIFELKEAKNDFSFDEIGKYFSALANEANLRNASAAWLIFGVRDKDRSIVGSRYRTSRSSLDSLKQEIAKQTTAETSFIEIHEVDSQGKRVLMFQIPAAPKGIPVAFKGHYYARNGESLAALSMEKIERIRSQSIKIDWSAMIVSDATLDDLDPAAIAKARENYLAKYLDKATEAKEWDTVTFLNKAKLTIKGRITNTALLLLGREESEHYLHPADAKIRWVLKDLKNQEKDYETFSIPFLLSAEKVNLKIRNLKYRYMKEGTLFPEEVQKYEPFVIREALNNCIAHQDYEKGGRINVIEIEDEQLIFTNLGDFIPGSVERVVTDDSPSETYRNPFLVSAMFNLKMVDTAGGGIKKMFTFQKDRFFPLPDYELGDSKVKVIVTGKVLDMEFARVLAKNPDLTLNEIIMLDKIQKRKPLNTVEAEHLKDLGLIEGRKPNYLISSNVIAKIADTDLKAQYVKMKAFDDEHYRKLIVEYLKTYGSATRKDIDRLLLGKLPDVLDTSQKGYKISNLLGSLRRKKVIQNEGTTKSPRYVLIL
jgi:ATP-dependent DNA helicase RecG